MNTTIFSPNTEEGLLKAQGPFKIISADEENKINTSANDFIQIIPDIMSTNDLDFEELIEFEKMEYSTL